MSPRRTRRGTIRESVSEISINNSIKSSSKATRSTRRVNKSQIVKGLEEDSDSPIEVSNLIDHIAASSTLNDTSISTQRRRRKAQESEIHKDNSLSATIDVSKTSARSQKSRSKTPKTKRQTKSNKSKAVNINSLISEDESLNEKNPKKARRVSYTISNLISEDESSNSSSKGKIQLDNQRLSTNNKEFKTPEKTQSSPLNVSFTPNRSKKTPRKSPINLGSPKTHSRNSLKVLNVPRKLSIADSPPSSENSIQQCHSSITDKLSVEQKSKSHEKLNSVNQHSNKNKSTSTSKTISRFSKSPKIVLKSPKLKTPKSSKKLSPKKTKASSSKVFNTSVNSVDSSLKLGDSSFSKKSKELSLAMSTEKSVKLRKSKSPLKYKKSPKFISPLNSSKTPKIVLTLKSKRSSKSSKRKSSPTKLSKTSPQQKKSPKLVSQSHKKSIVNVSLDASMSPRVIINKLPSMSQINNLSVSAKKQQLSISLVPVDHLVQSPTNKNISIPKSKSPKSLKTSVKRLSTKSTPSVKIQMDSSIKPNGANISLKNHTPLERKLLSVKPRNTSTPRENIKRALGLNTKVNSSKKMSSSMALNETLNRKSKVNKRLSNQSKVKTDHPLLEDESEPSLNESSLINMSDVFDSDNSRKDHTFEIEKDNLNTSNNRKVSKDLSTSQNKSKNNTFELKDNSSNSTSKGKTAERKDNTYELENPKTPALQKRVKKRTLDEADLGNIAEPESKKKSKVHFANPNLQDTVQSSEISRVCTPGHAIQQKRKSLLVAKSKTPVKQLLSNKVESKNKSSSVFKLQIKSTLNTPINKDQNSMPSVNARKSIHEAQVVSVNRLSRPKAIMDSGKKSAIKTPVAKKIPNFNEIHQKNFAKMESLVDLKKRLEKRHVNLNSASSSARKSGSNKPLPSDSTNGAYNRFGFKLRKTDAVEIITKKQTGGVESREKKRENARNALKGVRMNRRFELQMQARTKNT